MVFFVMIDGLDGSGKGTALDALKEWAIKEKKNVLDLREYWKQYNEYPKKIDDYDVIISREPTSINYGKKIREKLISKDKNKVKDKKYTPREIAQAFAKDR